MMNQGDPGIFIAYATLYGGDVSMEWPGSRKVEGPTTRVEIGTKFVVQHKGGGQVALRLIDGRVVWIIESWFDDPLLGERYVQKIE